MKPGVKGPADTPEKMRRKGSFLRRHFANPNTGPLKDKSGKPTRRALSAQAWGEPIPQNADDIKKLAAKGKELLKQYHEAKENGGTIKQSKSNEGNIQAQEEKEVKTALSKTDKQTGVTSGSLSDASSKSSVVAESAKKQKNRIAHTTQDERKGAESERPAKTAKTDSIGSMPKQVKKELPKLKKEPKEKETRKAATKKAVSKKSDTYTNPALREKILQKIKAGDKGGRPGQWSARKAQMVAHEYKAAGGGYLKPYRTEAQKNLCSWTDEKWQTATGAKAIHGLTTSRYLPKKAWESLSKEEKEQTEKLKLEGSAKNQQYVANTAAAKDARRRASLRSTGEE